MATVASLFSLENIQSFEGGTKSGNVILPETMAKSKITTKLTTSLHKSDIAAQVVLSRLIEITYHFFDQHD